MIRFQYCITLFFLFASAVAQGQCDPYFRSVFESNTAISAELLVNEDLAIECLVQSLKRLSQNVVSPNIEESKRGALNRASAALLRIVDKGKMPPIDAIQKIRLKDDISVASVLSFGARNEDRETRLNSAGLLSNIIDNSTVCVPMDHLADPELLKSEWGINGRANLIAVVSVVAPWAYKSNYTNMKQLVDFLEKQLEGKENILETKDILNNLKARLLYQDTLSNPNRNSDNSRIMEGCQKMQPKWANTPQFKLNYPMITKTTTEGEAQ